MSDENNFFELTVIGVKLFLLVLVLLTVTPVMAWVERRGSALMQNRLGPNRIGPFGLLQSLADAIKFMWKQDIIPDHVEPFYYVIAPLVSFIPSIMTFAVIPFASSIVIHGHFIRFQVADLNVGVLYTLSIASLGVYGIVMAGWSSNSKYSVLGSLRSAAQMVSYELSMGLSIIGIIIVFSSLHLGEIVEQQGQVITHFGSISFPGWAKIPSWGIFLQPLGFIIFLVSVFAETNRLPFDLPEGESEIVAGYHLEYGSMKFAMFMMAEYLNMLTASGLIATLYFGGWQLFPGMGLLLELLQNYFGLNTLFSECIRVIFELCSFGIKVAFFMWFFVWVRWTVPRFRYDQLMDLGWRVLLPLSFLNIIITALLLWLRWI